MDADEYLAAIAAGDPGAFGAWVAVSEQRIRASLMRFAAQVDVECVTQECLLRVWQAAPTLTPDGQENALLRWAIRVARNLALSELRRRSARPVGHIDPNVSPEDELAASPASPDPLLRRVIAECRQALPRKPAQALSARLESGGQQPDSELASALGMKLNTFLKNFGRARKLLRVCLERHGVDLELT
jgi:RNA polymerase sigma-70 factor (ECF subfamily)